MRQQPVLLGKVETDDIKSSDQDEKADKILLKWSKTITITMMITIMVTITTTMMMMMKREE